MESLASRALRLRFYYGWTVVAAAGLVLFMAYGVQYSVGIMLAAMEEDLGWSRSQLSLAYTLYVIVYTTVGTVTGRLTDLWGPQRVMLAGGILLGAGLALLSITHAVWQFYLFFSLVAALGMSVAYVPCNSTVVRWFTARRGLALSITNLGSSVGIFLVPLAMGTAVAFLGWRSAYVGAGAAVFTAVYLASRFMVRSPESVGLPGDRGTDIARAATTSLRLREALRTRNFRFFAAAFFAAYLVALIPFVHLPSLITLDRGGSSAEGTLAASLIGAGAIFGVLMSGFLADRIGGRTPVVLAVVAEGAAFLGWLLAPQLAPLFAFVFGVFYGGSIVLMPAMAGELFGRQYAGSILGVLFACIGWAGSLGALGAGVGRDALGSYDLVFGPAVAVCGASAGLFLMVRMPARV